MHLIQIVPYLILLKQLFRRNFYTVDQMRPYYRISSFSDTNTFNLIDRRSDGDLGLSYFILVPLPTRPSYLLTNKN